MDLANRWNDHLRRASRRSKISCPLCRHEIQDRQNGNGGPESALCVFERHLDDVHAQQVAEKTSETTKTQWIQSLWEAAQTQVDSLEAGQRPAKTAAAGEGVQQPSNRRKPEPDPSGASEDRPGLSRTSSAKGQASQSPSVSPPRRSKARPVSSPPVDDSRADFDRGPRPKGKLWNPDDDVHATLSRPYDKSNIATYPQRQRPPSGSIPKARRQSHPPPPASDDEDEEIDILKQPETRPISHDQLVAEVKGIYAGLVMVESKCIEVDNAQGSSQNDPSNKLNNEQWQALIALHRTLLHEHHDFFLASQHPSASPALRRLAAKYAMPARMWRHGIHSFLELLRHRLPASLDHMLAFIYLAYSMMALLYETVPAFEDTWIECLGDLGRYRMAIEDDDIRDREVWTAVSRHWYSRASDKAPTTGRLYHHLAILARPNALQQLYYYSKSLCVEMPFTSARESIMTLFDPILAHAPNAQQSRLPPTELAFVKTHGILFSGKQQEELKATMADFFQLLDNHIGRSTRRWIESGYHTGLSNICAVMSYGKDSNPIVKTLKAATRRAGLGEAESQDQPMQESEGEILSADKNPADALELFEGTCNVVCRRFGDDNILSFLHVTLVFVHHLTYCPDAMAYVAPHFPWKLTALTLNTFLASCQSYARVESEQFPRNESAVRPLPDDFALRGFPFVDRYLPDDWFADLKIDDDDKYFEVPSMTEERKERVLWLGCRIAAHGGDWLRYDHQTHQFGVNPRYEVELDLPAAPADSVEYGELPDAATPA